LPVQQEFRKYLGIENDLSKKSSDISRIRMTIAFHGKNYQGWQRQTVGVGVQQIIEKVLARLYPESEPLLQSSSRTDTGVHALGLVAHVDLPLRPSTPLIRLANTINAHPPSDIRIVSANAVSSDFHARYHAQRKQYRYQVWNHSSMNPLMLDFAWHVPNKLDFALMRQAAKRFEGTHDFRAFTNKHPYPLKDAVRKLNRVSLKKSGALLTVVIEGEGFLYKMCRNIVGVMVQVGQGRFSLEDLEQMFESKDRTQAGVTPPPHGLTLWKVFY